MKIFYISNMFPSKKTNDNYGIFCKNVYDALNDEYFKVTKLAVIYGKSFNKLFNVLRYFSLMLRIYSIGFFCNKSFDAVYFQYIWLHVFASIPLIKKWKKQNKKIILNFHGEDLIEFINDINSKNKYLVETADRIIFPSSYFKNVFLEKYSVEEKKIFVSPSGGVNKKIFFPDKKIKKENLIVFCSRFAKDKGWDDFINALCLVHSTNKNLEAVLIGYGEEISDAKKLIIKTKSDSFIKIYEKLPQKQIADIYRKSLVFVFPTRKSESLGLVALEAMSCGLPVIGSNTAALPEYIDDGKNGFLFEKGNVQKLAKKINDFLMFPVDVKNKFSDAAINKSKNYEMNFVLSKLKQNLKEI